MDITVSGAAVGAVTIDLNNASLGSDSDQIATDSKAASSTLKVLRGTSTTTAPADAMDIIHTGKKVTVSAPTSSTIVIGHVEYVGTQTNTWKHTGYVYGLNQVQGVNQNSNIFDSSYENSNKVVSSEIVVL